MRRYGTISGMQELREGTDPAAALAGVRIARLPAGIDGHARAALWTGNNTFRWFSTTTLRMMIAAWFAALLLWAASRHRSAEWIVCLHCGLFVLALAYFTAISSQFTHGEATGPSPWYTQVLLVPMLDLALLGTSRSGKAGKIIALTMTLLFGYVLPAAYWVKLIPLYSGSEDRASLASLAVLYGQRLSTVMARLNDACLAPALPFFLLSGVVSILGIGQEVVLSRLLFWQTPTHTPLSGAGRRSQN